MKQLYRIITIFFLAGFWADVAYAQFEDDGIIGGVQIDTCASFRSFRDGCLNYEDGRDCFIHELYYMSEVYLKNAIRCFEQHLNECPGNVNTMHLLGYSYYMLFHACNTVTNKEYLEKAILYLPIDDTIARFDMHYYYGQYWLLGGSLSGIEPDYCKAFDEFNKAMAYDIDIEMIPDHNLISIYKSLYYCHASLLFDSYYNNIILPDTTTYCNEVEQSDWIACIGEQQLDHCMDDLNHIISLNDSLINVSDTLALVLFGRCCYFKGEYDKATYYYEKSGITPTQLMASFGYETVRCFLDSYYKQEIDDSAHITDDLSDVLFEFWRNNYRLMYMDKSNYKDNLGGWSELVKNVLIYYYSKEEFEKALDFWFKIRNNFSFDDVLLSYQGLCRYALGDTTAIGDFEFASCLNPQNGMSHLGMTLSNLSKENLSLIPSANKAVFLDGRDSSYYSVQALGLDSLYYLSQGWAHYCQKNYSVAKDYYMQLRKLNPSSDNLLMLAICYQKLAEQETDPITRKNLFASATRTFREVIDSEETKKSFSSAPYAYLYLGDSQNAIKTMEHILQTGFPSSIQTNDDSLTCYEIHNQAAEIYAQVHQLGKAKRHLKKSFEYCHIPLALNIAQNAPLLAPIQQYVKKEIGRYLINFEAPIHRDTIVSDIPFKKNGNSNTRTISCIINGIPVDSMLFDPGADYVQLTKAKADKLGVVFIGWQIVYNADGSPNCQRIVSLDTVRIGNIVLENVQAVINDDPRAPLLVGCTVWNNLKVEMPSPDSKGMIRLTYIKESIEIPEDKKNTDKQ